MIDEQVLGIPFESDVEPDCPTIEIEYSLLEQLLSKQNDHSFQRKCIGIRSCCNWLISGYVTTHHFIVVNKVH